MIKAKTKKSIFSIISAVIGVVFAFITGITYAYQSFAPYYEANPNSTAAYLGNQQYHIINDTVDNPIPFGDGTRNCEVALQYSVDYDFDVRIQYRLVWTNSKSSENVVLHFADRDNIIYDEDYIFFTTSFEAGEGKRGTITGVDFTNFDDQLHLENTTVNTSKNYNGQTLTIEIVNVKIYKAGTYTDPDDTTITQHPFYSVASGTSDTAMKAWRNVKRNVSGGYIMMYNQRRNYANGVSYPGLKTAYRKATKTTQVDGNPVTEVTGATWLGGNRSFAGVGMYVMAGTQTLEFSVKVSGIWRLNNNGTITDSKLISENSIRFNYTKDWTNLSWDVNNLWETRTYNYTIPAGTNCYIDILDSIEITCASRIETNQYDSYRAVVNSIAINESASTTFTYTENDCDKIQLKQISTSASVETKGNYTKPTFSIVNSSKYSSGLFSSKIGSGAAQTFNTSISLINNESTPKTITANFNLKYSISNGVTTTVKTIGGGTTEYRIEQLFVKDGQTAGAGQYVDNAAGRLQAFKESNIWYSYDLECPSNYYDGTLSSKTVTIAPYSSVTILDTYTAPADIQGLITPATSFGGLYDVWTYVDVATSAGTSTKTDLLIESEISSGVVNLSVKNNSQKTITGVEIDSLYLKQYTYTYKSEATKKADWEASYWQHYYGSNGSATYTPITANPVNETTPEYPTNVYSKEETFETLSLTANEDNGFTKTSATEFDGDDVVLEPGESIVFASATLISLASQTNRYRVTNKIYVGGQAKATSSADPSQEIKLINSGNKNAFLINRSETASYYVSFTGTVSSIDNVFTYNFVNYYIGIIRPGQIVSLPMTTMGEITPIEVNGDYDANKLNGWADQAKVKMTNLFAIQKS